MAVIKYGIEEEIRALSESSQGWIREFNRISWNGGIAKYGKKELAKILRFLLNYSIRHLICEGDGA